MKESKEYLELKRICTKYFISKIPRRFKRVCKKYPDLVRGHHTTYLSLVGFSNEPISISLDEPIKVHKSQLASVAVIKKESITNPLLAEKISLLVHSILMEERNINGNRANNEKEVDLFSMKSNEEKMRELLLTLKSKLESLVGN